MSARKQTWRRCEQGHTWNNGVTESAASHLAMHPDGEGFTAEPFEPATETPRQSGARVLLDLFDQSRARLILDQYGEAFAKMRDRRVLPLSGGGLGGILTQLYVQTTDGNPPPKGSVGEALTALRSRALDAETEPVYLRFGPLPDGKGVAIDLGDDDYKAIVIRPGTWGVESHPVNFRRTPAMEPLPEPEHDGPAGGGDLVRMVHDLLNVTDDDAARLVVAFLVSLLKPEGPYLGLAMTGPAGSAKTFAARVIRRILDPVSLDGGGGVRTMPRNADDFASIVTMNAITIFDNLSGSSSEQADWLAQLMTGYSNERRRLYTDDESVQRSAKRPVLLTGIDITDRGDLLSRLLVVELKPLPSFATEAKLWRSFDVIRAPILGALCDVVADAYLRLPGVHEEGWKVRMADVARFVTAAEHSLGWAPGWTEKALAESQGDAVVAVLSTQSWYPPLIALLAAHGDTVNATPTDLLDELTNRYVTLQMDAAGRGFVESSDRPRSTDLTWPKSPKALTETLKRHTAGLMAVGITHAVLKSHGVRLIAIESRAIG